MPSPTEGTVRLTVLDRLIDEDLRSGRDAPMRWRESVSSLKASLLRDMEWLLNTRQVAEPAPESLVELRHSVYHYGLPDIASLAGHRDEMEQVLLREIEEAIRLFEPRLTAVRVTPARTEDATRRQIRFTVEGLLRLDPNPERVVFDTVLDSSSGKIMVAGADGA